MKNVVIGLLLIGLTSLGFSQNTGEIEEVQLEGVEISNVNLSYLEKVQDNVLPAVVISLENEASVFDVKELDEFDGRKKFFKVKFTSSKGYIIADYYRNGKIVKTSERFKDIALPKNLIRAVLKQYPKSSFLKVAYNVDYDGTTAEKIYRIKIMNDGKKKNLAINPEANLNNAVSVSLNK